MCVRERERERGKEKALARVCKHLWPYECVRVVWLDSQIQYAAAVQFRTRQLWVGHTNFTMVSLLGLG